MNETIHQFWEMLGKGGIVMIPLFLTSILGLAVVIERAFNLRRKRIIIPEAVEMIQRIEKPEDLEKASGILQWKKGPFLNIVKVTLENHHLSKMELKDVMIDQGRHEARNLEKGLVILETIASISPLSVQTPLQLEHLSTMIFES